MDYVELICDGKRVRGRIPGRRDTLDVRVASARVLDLLQEQLPPPITLEEMLLEARDAGNAVRVLLVFRGEKQPEYYGNVAAVSPKPHPAAPQRLEVRLQTNAGLVTILSQGDGWQRMFEMIAITRPGRDVTIHQETWACATCGAVFGGEREAAAVYAARETGWSLQRLTCTEHAPAMGVLA